MNFVTFFNLLVISMTLAFTSANAEVTTYKSRRVNARYRLAVTWTAPASSTPYVLSSLSITFTPKLPTE